MKENSFTQTGSADFGYVSQLAGSFHSLKVSAGMAMKATIDMQNNTTRIPIPYQTYTAA
ncbi:hypothetical protein DYY67_0786 [Candidatus Nitrosotalea sp. TS]|uniref:hypothetical protein n=1 Tax=Candidatus Nitrosotalea sp. TS TaxID=2341020 RepID=UPI001EBBAD9C|nr:hypothetical protein [Candidatus Nitrosotalea sp. TS]NHI03716.1 hypothetical protein [Candidatus Nitrosotalea sp. TS]